MNAQHEIDRLLEKSGAVLVRQNRHLVYRLPNGKTFVAAKTPSDPDRAAKNSLSDLRRALGMVRELPETKGDESVTAMEQTSAPGAVVIAPEATAEAPQKECLKVRIEAAIAGEEIAQERLLAEAQMHERKVHMLKALLPFAEEPTIEDSLRGLVPGPELVAQPKPTLPLEPPQVISEHVEVTRQLVFAATQTFEGIFTVNAVMNLMTGGRHIEGKERLRVRQSIAQAMTTLSERGELIKEEARHGRRETVWRKALLSRHGADDRRS